MLVPANKYVQWILVIGILLSCYVILGFHDVLFLRPISIHQSAQASRASIALNYFQEGMNFFEPTVHGCKNTTGITGSEFPLMNYAVALCYKLFGFHEFWYRFLMLITITIGLIFSIKISRLYISDFYISLLISLVWYMSPVLVYYSPNFNPDTASLGFTMISWFFFLQYTQEKSKNTLFFWFFWITLAALIKVISLISVGVVIALIILDSIKFLHLKFNKKQVLYMGIYIALTFLLVYIWYAYAKYLTVSNSISQFSLSLHTPKTIDTFFEVWKTMSWLWIPVYYNKVIYWFMLISGVSFIVLYKYVPRVLIVITLFLYFGAILFFAVMLPQFKDHDYYIITLLPAFFFHILTFIIVLQNRMQKKIYTQGAVLLLLGLFIHSGIHARNHQVSRYQGLYFSWEKDLRPYYNLEPHIRALGISRTQKFVSLYDWTPNNTLYLIDQKGWTINNDNTNLLVALGDSEYALINDTSILNNSTYNRFFNNPIAQFEKNILLFEITHKDTIFNQEKVFGYIK